MLSESSRGRHLHKYLNKYWNNPLLWEQYGKDDYYSERASFVKSIIPDDVNSLLDVGAGKGEIINSLMGNIDTVVGLDISEEALKYLNCEAVLGSIENLPFCDKSFDLVMCMEVLEHVPAASLRRGIHELQRVARNYLLVSVPYNENIDSRKVRCPHCKMIFNIDTHFRSFKTERELCELFPEFHLSKKWLSGPSYRRPSRVGLFIQQKIMNIYHPLDQYFVCIYCGTKYSEFESKQPQKKASFVKKAFKLLRPISRLRMSVKILGLFSYLQKNEACWMFVLLKRNDY